MFRHANRKPLSTLLTRSSAIALIAAFMPLGIDLTDNGVTIDAPAAHAKGGGGGGQGGGGGGGNGGGNGNGGNGNDGGAEAAGASSGPGHGNGNGVGTANGVGQGNNHGATASALGALNAAHALVNGSPNAAPNSRVGRIEAAIGPLQDMVDAQALVELREAELEAAVGAVDIAAAQAALGAAETDLDTKQDIAETSVTAAANKPVDQSVMDALADLLGL